jgi:flagellar assembly protein FliH
MLSKVIQDGMAGAEPVPWRSSSALQTANAGDGGNGRLQARITELEAALDAKTKQAYTAGVRAGEDAARQKLEGEVNAAVEELAETIAGLAGTRTETIRRAEADVVRLSIEIARRVLHRELATDNAAMEALIKAALEKLQGQEIYRVRVNPERQQAIRDALGRSARGQAIEVIADPAQPKGGAVFEIGRGALDASVETQLAEIEQSLIGQLETRA